MDILKAFMKDGAFAYCFFVSKPTEFLFVGNVALDSDREKELLKVGIKIRKYTNNRRTFKKWKRKY